MQEVLRLAGPCTTLWRISRRLCSTSSSNTHHGLRNDNSNSYPLLRNRLQRQFPNVVFRLWHEQRVDSEASESRLKLVNLRRVQGIGRRLCSVHSPRAVSASIRFRRRGHRCPVFHSVGTSALKNAPRLAGTSCQHRVARWRTISICPGLRRSSRRRDDSGDEEAAAGGPESTGSRNK